MMNPKMNDRHWQERTDAWVKAQHEQRIKKENHYGDNMKVRNKEHQFLGREQLQDLCDDFPNDQKLGEYIRKLSSATTNNPQGTSGYEPVAPPKRTADKDNEYETKRFANQTGSRWKYYLEHEL